MKTVCKTYFRRRKCVYWISYIDQVFFKNGELSNDFPKESYKYYEKNAIDGDLQGIIQEMDYLNELGIDLIYLGPIFKAQTTHGYDVIDYFSISENISSVSEEEANDILKKIA